jgi:hypothetical protein
VSAAARTVDANGKTRTPFAAAPAPQGHSRPRSPGAREAARQDVKYTEALRSEIAENDVADMVDANAGTAESRELVVAALSEIVVRDGVVPVRVIPAQNPPQLDGWTDRWGTGPGLLSVSQDANCAACRG